MKNTLLLGIVLATGFIMSCGIKGPPLPPLKAADTQAQVNSQPASQDTTKAEPVKTPAKKTKKK